ncbi:MAG: helix-hairpin-helix domain-containing protein [Candidatus Poribacteria bacterium]|nr:helix-hairpin-helix domain-containing protein [Candidatus Poribacteria bacterium]MDE0505056.1 helix-hairpin-helix domain-containing protein [Candidatus Poribacteria bacterium]
MVERIPTARLSVMLRLPLLARRLWRNVCRSSNERGLSLVAALWILTILSVLATQLLHSIFLERRVQANFADRTKYHFAAKAGFEHTIAMLLGDDTPFDSLGEVWADTVEDRIEDGTMDGMYLTYRVDIRDESSKVNINTAEPDTIQRLLNLVGYEDIQSPGQSLPDSIVASRPFRTVRDLARVPGMTTTLLYGRQQQSVGGLTVDETETQNIPGLLEYTTIYSVDTNTDASGQNRLNVRNAEQQQLTQLRANNNQPVFSQGEADSLIQQRDSIENVGDVLGLKAISEQTFDSIRDKIGTEGGDGDEGTVNINTADSNQLQTLDGIDDGVANRIIDHRNTQGNFQNVDAIKDVNLVTTNEFKSIVDKISTTDDEILNGLINVNTASLEVLKLLPGMDESKAQAVITRRESEPEDNQQPQLQTQDEIEGNPFTDIGQLLDVEGIAVDTFEQIAGLVSYRSHGFLIEADGIDAGGRIISSCTGVVDRTGQTVTVKYWRQN